MPPKAIPAEAFEHGTIRRARGSRSTGTPRCHCQPCRQAERAYTKHRLYLAHTGRSLLIDATPAREHLLALKANGDALTNIAKQIGRPRSSLVNIANGENKQITRTLASLILAVRPGTATACNWSVPAIGSIRRIRALMALGHSVIDIKSATGIEHTAASALVNGRPASVHHELAQRVDKGYRQLCQKRGTSVRSLRRAAREAWAPPGAWDEHSIDEPDAHPDWTGHCGTDRGWWTHRLEQLPACQPCDMAHEQWKQERAHLTSKERWAELARARAVAANREGNLAADARELLRLDIPIDVIATRLGVTRNHLQQAMLRHPAQQDVEAVA